jgi:rubrerythrin
MDLISREESKIINVPVNDCISRQDAIEAVEHITSSMSVCINTDECHGMKRMQRQAVIELANLPTAEKVGKWKYETMRHIITGEMRTVRICSECGGGWFRYDLSDGVEDSEPNYCPNCGSRMMEGEEG